MANYDSELRKGLKLLGAFGRTPPVDDVLNGSMLKLYKQRQVMHAMRRRPELADASEAPGQEAEILEWWRKQVNK